MPLRPTPKLNEGRAAAALLLSTLLFVCLAAEPAAAQKPQAPASAKNSAAPELYSCPMHPEVASKSAGRCPRCGMNLRRREPAAAPANAAAQPTATTGETNAAPRIPATEVLDQDGRRLDFYRDLVKGKTVAINFIFTTCTTICPPMTATFRRVQQLLGERAGRDVSLISVSVDPATDTPERLKAFAERFKAGPGWTFVTGGAPEMGALLKALGAAVGDKNDHTPVILVGNDAAGRWTRAYGLSPAATLLKVIDEAAARQPAAPADKERIARASASYFPNQTLLTQDEKPVRFYEDMLKGKVVLINFMFAQCKGVCSPMTANLAKVQGYLGGRVGRDISMLSITVDPDNDTPAVLKEYAARHKAGPGWYFLTGRKEDVDAVLNKLGGYVAEPGQHTSVLIIGNVSTGEWLKVHAMSSAAEIAAAVVKVADGETGQR